MFPRDDGPVAPLTTSLVVRRASEEDWALLRSIRLESLADTPEAFGSTYEEAIGLSDERWRIMARDRFYVLAERAGRVVGLVSGGLNERWPETHWLYAMYVTPDERGRGAADALVAAVAAWAQTLGALRLYLEVVEGVERARAFYTRVGFVESDDVQSSDRDGRRFVLVKDLS